MWSSSVGGHRITNELAKELGYDAGFTKGTFAIHVAEFIVGQLLKRQDSLSF